MSDTSAVIPVTVTTDHVQIGGFGTHYVAAAPGHPLADIAGGPYALLEHTLGPGLIGAPPHRHAREDELSYVIAGRLAVWRAGHVTEVGPGETVAKPRGEWHTFWNASPDEPVRFLELISPPAFAHYFRELAGIIPPAGPPDPAAIARLAARYGLEFDFPTLGAITERHGVRLG